MTTVVFVPLVLLRRRLGAERRVGLAPPGHLIWGADDPFQGPERGQRMADRTGARLTVLEGCGHRWQVERPDEGVAVMREFWARVDDAIAVAS